MKLFFPFIPPCEVLGDSKLDLRSGGKEVPRVFCSTHMPQKEYLLSQRSKNAGLNPSSATQWQAGIESSLDSKEIKPVNPKGNQF